MVSYLQSMRRTVKDLQTMPVESSRAGASQWGVPKHPKTQEVSRTWPGNMPPFGAPRVLQVPRPRRRRPTWRGSLVTKVGRSLGDFFCISLKKNDILWRLAGNGLNMIEHDLMGWTGSTNFGGEFDPTCEANQNQNKASSPWQHFTSPIRQTTVTTVLQYLSRQPR
jgi:hypothetical protein